jgi:hypothetical protein
MLITIGWKFENGLRRESNHISFSVLEDDDGDSYLDILVDKIREDKDAELEKKEGRQKGEEEGYIPYWMMLQGSIQIL